MNVETISVDTTPDAKQSCLSMGLRWIDKAVEIEDSTVEVIDAELAVRLRVIPLELMQDTLHLAMLYPEDFESADEVATITGKPITRCGMEQSVFSELMRKHYGTTAARMAESLGGQTHAQSDVGHNMDAIEADNILVMAEQPTLINLVNLLLLEAIQQRASDVHIEPFETELKVKYRIDGVLVEQPPPPRNIYNLP